MSELAQNNAVEDSESSEYLSFVLGEEQYAVEILQVQEIRGWQPVTPIPNTPDYFCGVLNLRGAIIPIIDLRLRLGMPFLEHTKTTVVVVLKLKNENKIVGLVVDAVSDTHQVDKSAIQPIPELGAGVETQFSDGLVELSGQMVMLINVTSLLMKDGKFL
ncbi:chemotaxis protein CheW [Methylophaga sp. OBS3]|uniref:chemotaxis protein CheW n=1 Tax=Methylophaga sp. OBS3 TaxID=2991934 RepID=UPI00225662C1|nr:chemotaxis protein CheW [Methylophaga sp. OBS3]MCX4188859.1 chemotaxis protein CheW [Methylophaga sp. OBS3]